jgi:hypothetical protein
MHVDDCEVVGLLERGGGRGKRTLMIGMSEDQFWIEKIVVCWC